ncbi:hypothetical protein DFH07DRAFT_440762 [Mycena maculata]|uniref:Uncharacterized protein n=1 Tax=Mycena maculata TaxID=230809 RepID=A0AAD7K903_9AGAR|nr:hypothetical protein DFH07DRAFT_440762 [Mycena maculata]
MKPPLELVEKYFRAGWRTHDDQKERASIAKSWERYREIPQWIANSCDLRGVPPTTIIAELEAMRGEGEGPKKGLNWLRKEVETMRKNAAKAKTNRSGTSPPLGSTAAVAGPSASSDSTPAPESSTVAALGPAFAPDIKRKRADPVDPRRQPPKKTKA